MPAPTEIIPPKKKRGAPSGNQNAFKHGFYARNLGLVSPTQLPEKELRNLLGEAAMLKDYMYILYNCNITSHDSAVLADTLRALALASMAVARLLQVHNHIRVAPAGNLSSLDDLLADMDAAASRANSLASSVSRSTRALRAPDPDDDDLGD